MSDATTILLTLVSPLLVALIRRCAWPTELVQLMALAVVTLLYVIGRWVDGALILGEPFWVGLVAAYGAQQLTYQFLLKDRPVIAALERAGEPDIPPIDIRA